MITDSGGNVLGNIETMPDGRQCLTARLGDVLGYYDPNSDTTTDRLGTIIGQGNLLKTLLPNC
ncbi:hypothetical protein CO111_06280 [Candidatus Desantisbacteria bacterium CG_4_9_14_3_um_filter_50_7]|nr:MAG: hypothetical protein CO111_06280 [Candidatus Desantisbacteria bacterium CG_4_9_14_3_um_filter_50_7]